MTKHPTREIRFRFWHAGKMSDSMQLPEIEAVLRTQGRLLAEWKATIYATEKDAEEALDAIPEFSIGGSATSMQWTGLLDSDQKPIYEGDILVLREDQSIADGAVGNWEGPFFVVWDNRGKWSLVDCLNKPYDDDTDTLALDLRQMFVVKGNIFEHPELAKRKAISYREMCDQTESFIKDQTPTS